MKSVLILLANNPLSALWMVSHASRRKERVVVVFTGLDPVAEASESLAWLVEGATGDHLSATIREGSIGVLDAEVKELFGVSLPAANRPQREAAYRSWIDRQLAARSRNERSVGMLAKSAGFEFAVFYEPLYQGLINVDFRAIASVRKERERKRDLLSRVRDFLSEMKIDPKDLSEIHFANGNLQYFFAQVSSSVRLVGFEHGIGDLLRNIESLGRRGEPVPLRHRLKNAMIRFDSATPRIDRAATLISLAEAIPGMDPIVAASVKETSRKYCDLVPGIRGSLESVGVLLVNTGSHLGGAQWDEAAFADELVTRLMKSDNPAVAKVTRWIVKTRQEHKALAPPYMAALERNFPNSKAENIEDAFGENLNLEIYWAALRPKVLVACLSSSLFYAKALDPETVTVSFHKVFQEFCRIHFGKSEADIEMLEREVLFRYPKLVDGEIDAIL